jgi:HD superfamily phosphodiesterase
VEKLAIQILRSEVPIPSDELEMKIRFAAIFHDIGKISAIKNHANHSRIIAQKWIRTNVAMKSKVLTDILLMIEEHSNKNVKSGFESSLLKDADLLDETGAMAIVMNIYSLDKSDVAYYKKLIKQLNSKELEFCNKAFDKLHTKAAKKMLNDRILFVKQFIRQLESEILITDCDLV